MKYIIMAFVLLGLSGLLAANVTATAVSDSAKAGQQTGLLPNGDVVKEFTSLLQWFIYALIIITVFSGIRILLQRRKKPKDQDGKPIQPGQPDQSPKDTPPPLYPPGAIRQKRTPISWTFIVIMVFLALLFVYSWSQNKAPVKEVSYSAFVGQLNSGLVKDVEFTDRDIIYSDTSGSKYHTLLPPIDDPDLVKGMLAQKVKVTTKKPSHVLSILSYVFPFILLLAFYFFFLRGMNNQNSRAFSFGKSKARLHEASKSSITFKDVAGVDEAKEELQEIVEFLKDPKKFQRLGGRIPRGVLLVGRPGTGKTLLAKAVSGEAGVPFFSISGSDFVEMFVGVGAARVRDLFEQAKKNSPCITFIDEIDAVGRHRGTGLGGGHDEREQTLNQLLVEMDGFEPNEAVIIIAATNRPDILDPALLRPGRFDRQVTVDLPDIKGRLEILNVHSTKVPLADDVNLELIARGTPGFSGADLANIVNEAALIAARYNKQALNMSDFEEAKDKLILGKEKKSRIIPDEDKKMTAFHEIGHVLTSIFQDKTEPVHKVSIIPRGFTLGATHYLLTDKTGYSRSYLEQMMTEFLGGRAAEEIVFGELTTGAGNDLERVTEIAKKMVCTWGMSDKVGPMTIGKEQGEVYLGKELVGRDVHSNETVQMVDSEIREFISNAYQNALKILNAHKDLLEALSLELFEQETLGAEEIFEFILTKISGAEHDLVQKKYDRAKEMRFEHGERLEEKRAEEKQKSEPVEPETDKTDEPTS
jgi:cell division protease FtsH